MKQQPISQNKHKTASSVVMRFARKSQIEYEKREAEKRLRRIDQEPLAVEGVADYLFCSVPSVRNISDDLLPKRNGPGKRKLYLKKDIIAYLERSQETSPELDEILDELAFEELDSKVDSGKRHSGQRSSGNE